MNRKSVRTAATAAAALTLALGVTACGAANEQGGKAPSGSKLTGTLNAGGSSAQESAVAAWKKAFQSANPGVTVNYDPVGSGGGREQFLAGGLDLAGSDAYLDDDELKKAKDRCKSDVVEVPVYVSPIAVIYNVDGVDDLNLSPKTVAGIFEGKITMWNDAAIKADNPNAKLPATKISPVHRSDDSGTTENFTDYLDQAGEGAWSGGKTKTWPTKSGEAAEGTSGVVAAVTNGKGTIGYADAGQAGDLGKANIKVGDSYTTPSADAAAKVLDASTQVKGRAATDVAINVDRKLTDKGVYPIVLVSYQIACKTYDKKGTAELVKSWLTYISSAEGQQAAAKDAGSAPLSDTIAEKVKTAVETVSAA
jgi:phosphate transport system substrate-binding protein